MGSQRVGHDWVTFIFTFFYVSLKNEFSERQSDRWVEDIFREKHSTNTVWAISEDSSVQFSHSVMSDSLRPHESQHARPPCPSPTPGVHSHSPPLSQWCHPTISSSVIPFASCPLSFPASGSFQMSQLFASGGQSIGVSASTSVLPMNIQGWFPLGLNGLISLLSKGL